jgi:hypothetical protein
MLGATPREEGFLLKNLPLLLLTALALVTAGSAGATHTDPMGFQNVSPFLCSPSTNGQYSHQLSSTAPIRIRYGWGALQPSQLDKFLAVQSGTVTVRDSLGSIIVSDSWGEGDSTGWSAYFSATLTGWHGGATYDGWATRRHTVVGLLAPGTYRLDVALRNSKTVFDGFGSVPKGAWGLVSNCSFTVVA